MSTRTVAARTLVAALAVVVVAAIGALGWRRFFAKVPTTIAIGEVDGGVASASVTAPAAVVQAHVDAPIHRDFSGTKLHIVARDEPAPQYGAKGADVLSAHIGAAVVDEDIRAAVVAAAARLPETVVYDRDLAHGAGEVANQAVLLGDLPPEAVVSWLLGISGSPELATSAHLTERRDADDGAANVDEFAKIIANTVALSLEELPPGQGPIRIGVAEAVAESGHVVVVLVSRRDFELSAPVATTVMPGNAWSMRFTSNASWHDLVGEVLQPDGSIEEIPLVAHGGDYELTVTPNSDHGEISISIDGVGRAGPGKLLQFTVWIGARPPRAVDIEIPPADPSPIDDDKAEAWALSLLQRDRAALGVAPLQLDSHLAAIARAHSVDMRDHKFFGHRSPSTGMLGARLSTIAYRAITYGENLARNDRLGEAEASLLASVGHRQNIINPRFTHVGIGVARDLDGDWYVTQDFARPAPNIDGDAPHAIAANIDRARAAQGLPALHWNDALTAVAMRGATTITNGPLDDVTQTVSESARGLVAHRAEVAVSRGADLDEVKPPAASLTADAHDIGVGVFQDPSSGGIGVVIIVGD